MTINHFDLRQWQFTATYNKNDILGDHRPSMPVAVLSCANPRAEVRCGICRATYATLIRISNPCPKWMCFTLLVRHSPWSSLGPETCSAAMIWLWHCVNVPVLGGGGEGAHVQFMVCPLERYHSLGCTVEARSYPWPIILPQQRQPSVSHLNSKPNLNPNSNPKYNPNARSTVTL